jgi:recombinational DNA repair protein (RecF pathway)
MTAWPKLDDKLLADSAATFNWRLGTPTPLAITRDGAVLFRRTPPRDFASDLYELAPGGALRTLAQRSSPLVTSAFFWKLLSLEGFHPMLDGCARCTGTGDDAREGDGELVAFDLDEGGTICRACARGAGFAITPAALDLLRRMLGGGLNRVLAEPPGVATHEVEQLGIRALEHHVERRLRSTALL